MGLSLASAIAYLLLAAISSIGLFKNLRNLCKSTSTAITARQTVSDNDDGNNNEVEERTCLGGCCVIARGRRRTRGTTKRNDGEASTPGDTSAIPARAMGNSRKE